MTIYALRSGLLVAALSELERERERDQRAADERDRQEQDAARRAAQVQQRHRHRAAAETFLHISAQMIRREIAGTMIED